MKQPQIYKVEYKQSGNKGVIVNYVNIKAYSIPHAKIIAKNEKYVLPGEVIINCTAYENQLNQQADNTL